MFEFGNLLKIIAMLYFKSVAKAQSYCFAIDAYLIQPTNKIKEKSARLF